MAKADLNGDGTPEWLIGCANGALIAVDANGKTLWTHTFTGAVNALAVTDLDGDKGPEIACAVEDSHLHVLNADGTMHAVCKDAPLMDVPSRRFSVKRIAAWMEKVSAK